MRTTFIVSYDIADAKRLRRVFKICCNDGNHLQFSVFECDFSQAEKIELERKLGATMNLKRIRHFSLLWGQRMVGVAV
jgi:CRISPR-associated protein Cas2